MDEISKKFLNSVGIFFNEIHELDGQFIPRENFLSDSKYEELKNLIPDLKKKYSSSMMTSLQKNANIYQRWPLLNLIRQILNSVGYKMEPIRKSDGYTLDGIKKYKRYFQIIKKKSNKKDDNNEKDEKYEANEENEYNNNNKLDDNNNNENIKIIDIDYNFN